MRGWIATTYAICCEGSLNRAKIKCRSAAYAATRRSQYVMKRQAVEEELSRHAPPIDAALAQAEALFDDFARFWGEA